MLAPAPRTALRRSPSPVAIGWKLPFESKGFNYHPRSDVGAFLPEGLARSLFGKLIDRCFWHLFLDVRLGEARGTAVWILRRAFGSDKLLPAIRVVKWQQIYADGFRQ